MHIGRYGVYLTGVVCSNHSVIVLHLDGSTARNQDWWMESIIMLYAWLVKLNLTIDKVTWGMTANHRHVSLVIVMANINTVGRLSQTWLTRPKVTEWQRWPQLENGWSKENNCWQCCFHNGHHIHMRKLHQKLNAGIVIRLQKPCMGTRLTYAHNPPSVPELPNNSTRPVTKVLRI